MRTLLLFISLAAIAVSPTTSPTTTTIGIFYWSPSSFSQSEILSLDGIADKVVSMKIPAVRLPDSNPAMINAFANTNVSLCLTVPNPLVQSLASSRSVAIRWVNHHVLRFYPRTKISIISVGNDAKSDSQDVSPFVLRAMENVHSSLTDLRFYKIAVSTTFSFFDIVVPAALPSSAQFRNPKGEEVIRPILEFLESTNSSFLVSFYPYSLHRLSFSASIELALFHESPLSFVDDISTGVRYHNLWDMMVDAVLNSMAVLGHENIPVIVAETGWGSSEIDAGGEVNVTTDLNSQISLKALLTHLRSGLSQVSEVYFTDLDLVSLLTNHQDPRVSSTKEVSMLDFVRSLASPGVLFATVFIGVAVIVVVRLESWLPLLERLKKLLVLFLKLVSSFKALVSIFSALVDIYNNKG